MIALLCFVLAAPFKPKSRLEAENAALLHQLIVLRRNVQGRVRLTNNDRRFFIQLYRWFPSILKVLTIRLNSRRTSPHRFRQANQNRRQCVRTSRFRKMSFALPKLSTRCLGK